MTTTGGRKGRTCVVLRRLGLDPARSVVASESREKRDERGDLAARHRGR
jgi:hypothetical protein